MSKTITVTAGQFFLASPSGYVEVEIDGTWHQSRGSGQIVSADDANFTPGVKLGLWDGKSWEIIYTSEGEDQIEITTTSRRLGLNESLSVRGSERSIDRILDRIKSNSRKTREPGRAARSYHDRYRIDNS